MLAKKRKWLYVAAGLVAAMMGIFGAWRASRRAPVHAAAVAVSKEQMKYTIHQFRSETSRRLWKELPDEVKQKVTLCRESIREAYLLFVHAQSHEYRDPSYLRDIMNAVERQPVEVRESDLDSLAGDDAITVGGGGLTFVVRVLHVANPPQRDDIVRWLQTQAMRYKDFAKPAYPAFVLIYLDRMRDRYGPLPADCAAELIRLRKKLGPRSDAGVEMFLADPQNY